MQKVIVEIKKPCEVDLNLMAPDSKGRFCSVCQTSVVDFTNKSSEEIVMYFQQEYNQNACGTFNAWDVKTGNKLDNFISYLYSKKLKFVAVLITTILILSGCKTRKHGRTSGNVRFLDEKINTIENVK